MFQVLALHHWLLWRANTWNISFKSFKVANLCLLINSQLIILNYPVILCFSLTGREGYHSFTLFILLCTFSEDVTWHCPCGISVSVEIMRLKKLCPKVFLWHLQTRKWYYWMFKIIFKIDIPTLIVSWNEHCISWKALGSCQGIQ